jgi:hypothetical protein
VRRAAFRRRAAQGYVLPLAIAILALAMLGAAAVARQAWLSLKVAQAEREAVEIEADLQSLEARLLFYLGAIPRFAQGLSDGKQLLKLDGTLYRASPRLLVSLQDGRGLFNLRAATRGQLDRFLATFGLDDATIAALGDIWEDYRDSDALRRLNGAEAPEYERAGLPPPSNLPQVVPNELLRMPRWREVAALWGVDGIEQHSYTGRGDLFNPYTATWRNIAVHTELPPRAAREIVRARNAGELSGLDRLGENQEGGLFGIVGLRGSLPGETVIISYWPVHASWGLRVSATHTPASSVKPWRIDYVQRIERKSVLPKPADTPPLPELDIGFDPALRERFGLPF